LEGKYTVNIGIFIFFKASTEEVVLQKRENQKGI
jgi:hypothetical protein